jgi:hypothetical protein
MSHNNILNQKSDLLSNHYLLKTKAFLQQKNKFSLAIFSILLLIGLNQIFSWMVEEELEQTQTLHYLTTPKVDDLYFLDFRLLSSALRPNEKFRLARVVDITGDIVTLLYGDFYYSYHGQIKDSIRYGHLRFNDYFQSKRYNFPLNDLKSMHKAGAIYLIKRPRYNQLYENYVYPLANIKLNTKVSNLFIPGKSENNAGEAFLLAQNIENSLENAFEYFQKSASLGYPKGQTNLAELYLNEQRGEKDLLKSLFWLKQAAKQSHKPAILKYIIVCKQVALCSEYDFYQELVDAGVNIKVRNVGFSLQ